MTPIGSRWMMIGVSPLLLMGIETKISLFSSLHYLHTFVFQGREEGGGAGRKHFPANAFLLFPSS